MPRPGPRRAAVGIRLSAAGIDAVDRRARNRGITRSAMLRLLLGYALREMPPEWQPPRRSPTPPPVPAD